MNMRSGLVTTLIALIPVASGVGHSQEEYRAAPRVGLASGTNHQPSLSAPERIVVEAGAVSRELLYAADPDGDELHFYKVSGPDYAQVFSPPSGNGGAFGSVRVAPTLCDVGEAQLVIGVSDQAATTQRRILVRVVQPGKAPPSEAEPVPLGHDLVDLVPADLNGDGHLDVLGVDYSGFISIALGVGDGTFLKMPDLIVPRGTGTAAIGDWNRDGRLDLATASVLSDSIHTWLGGGDGTFQRATSMRARGNHWVVRAADLNQDDIPDLVAAGGPPEVFLGIGDGTFRGVAIDPFGGLLLSASVADFNRDGVPDIVFTGQPQLPMYYLHGRGGGAFADAVEASVPETPFVIRSADLNWDGALDLVALGYSGGLYGFMGNGAGSFRSGSPVFTEGDAEVDAWFADAADWSGDGNPDIIVSGLAVERTIVYVSRGDETFKVGPTVGVGGPVAVGDFNEDGRPDVISGGADGTALYLNTRPPTPTVGARAFQANSNRTVPTGPPGGSLEVRVEPVGGSYANGELDRASLRLRSTETGSMSEIAPVAGKAVDEGDSDGNGVAEVSARFARADLARLFDQVRGRRTVSVQLRGALRTGAQFCTSLELTIVGTGPPAIAKISPNPLNPVGVLRFETTAPGRLRVQIFDLSGRLVRTLADRPVAAAGSHSLSIDGCDAQGRPLASGVYFLRVESSSGAESGRFAVLK